MKKLIILALLALASVASAQTYGDNVLTVEENDAYLLVEIVLGADNVALEYYMQPKDKADFDEIVEEWRVRLELGHNVKRQIETMYREYSDIAFEFNSGLDTLIYRSRDGDVTIYSFEMYLSDDYEAFMKAL